MPSRKILAILIICLGIVGAVWIFEDPGTDVAGSPKPSVADVTVATTTLATGNSTIDWQNILGAVQGTTTIASGLNNTSAAGYDDTTETAQLAKDFFGRYLLAQGQANQSGADTSSGLDTNTSDQIVSGVLSSGNYTTNHSVIYTAKNLNVQSDSGKKTVENYFNVLLKNSDQMAADDTQNGNEIDIINNAILNQDQNEITKLDPIIQSYQTLLSAMLKAPVPSDVADLHLEFVNSISKVLSDLQAIRKTFVDPVKSLAAITTYKQDYTDMSTGIQKLGTYLEMKAKSFTN